MCSPELLHKAIRDCRADICFVNCVGIRESRESKVLTRNLSLHNIKCLMSSGLQAQISAYPFPRSTRPLKYSRLFIKNAIKD